MSYRCVVIDDEKPARERIKRLLGRHTDFECVGEAGDAREALRVIDELEPDLCFLDVRMPEGDGFEVLERAGTSPHVIFTTAYDEYAVRAFEVRSLDYLLKPFDASRFAKALERARQALERPAIPAETLRQLARELRRARHDPAGESRPARISTRRGAKILLIDPQEILWFEAEETLVFARTAEGRSLVERTLVELERELEPNFFRAHRSCLVNVARIAQIVPGDAGTYRIVFGDDGRSSVPLSRRQARRLRERFPW